jgi:hypothetical protein
MRQKSFMRFMVLISWIMSSGISYGATWGSNKRLTFTSGDSWHSALAVNGLNVYVVWTDNTSGGAEIYFKKSVDGGATWQANKRLTYMTYEAVAPAIAVSGSSIYVVWSYGSEDLETDEIYFKKSTNGGATWQATRRLTYTTDLQYPDATPAIAVNGSNVYVTWHDNPSSEDLSDEIYFRKSTDGGATWQATRRLTYASASSSDPDIAVNGSDIHIIWPLNMEVYYKKSTDAGATWTAGRRLTWSAHYSCYPRIAVDSPGNLHMVFGGWVDGGMNEVFYKKSTDAGVTWTSPQRLTWTAADTYKPVIAVGSSGNLHVVWYDETPGNYEIYYRKSTNAGASWTASQRLTYNGGDSYTPDIAVNNSTVFITWDDNTPGNSEIYLTYSSAGSLVTPGGKY